MNCTLTGCTVGEIVGRGVMLIPEGEPGEEGDIGIQFLHATCFEEVFTQFFAQQVTTVFTIGIGDVAMLASSLKDDDGDEQTA